MDQRTPVNHQNRDLASIEADAQQAVATAKFYLYQAKTYGVPLDGARVLEIGPGHHFAVALILASHGAIASVTDRFVPKWDADFHPRLYKRIAELWDGEPTGALLDAIERPHDLYVTVIDQPAEMLNASRKFNIVYSNATLEHVYDFAAVCRALAGITEPGGINSHQIDFRDHRDFGRPLEFLCMPDDEFIAHFNEVAGEIGNRVRPIEAEQLFRGAGFDQEIPPYPNDRAKDDYLADFMPRLRASTSRFALWPEEELRVISALYVLRRSNH